MSIVRVSYVQAMQGNPDVTWTQAAAAVWSCLELNVGIICSCLATLKPFVRQHLPWLASAVGSATGGSGSGETSAKATGSSKSGFNPFRGDRANHSYQLHSIDRSKAPRTEECTSEGADGNNQRLRSNGHIVVTEDFHIRYHQKKSDMTDSSSAERILIGHEERGYKTR